MKTKQKFAFVLLLVLVFALTMPAYALEMKDPNMQLDKLRNDLHESEKHNDLQMKEKDKVQNMIGPTVIIGIHSCHSGDAHQNCDYATYHKSCGCVTITNYCCCGKKMNTDLILCSRHQIPYSAEQKKDR